MRPAKMTMAAVACALVALLSVSAASATETAVWLNVEVSDGMSDGPKVKINIPISMMEVVIDSLDASQIFQEMKTEHGVDLANLWVNLRDADTDEFLRIEHEDARIQVFKENQTLRLVIQETGYDEPNVQVQLPFSLLDYMVEGAQTDEFRLSDLVDRMRGSLPLMLVQADHDNEKVRIWLEER